MDKSYYLVGILLVVLVAGCQDYGATSHQNTTLVTSTTSTTSSRVSSTTSSTSNAFSHPTTTITFNITESQHQENERLIRTMFDAVGVPRIEYLDFEEEMDKFVQWMEEKGYHQKIIDVYIEDAQKQDLRRGVLGEYFFMKHIYGPPRNDSLDLESLHGTYLFKRTKPIYFTWYDVIPTDENAEYIPFNQSLIDRYAQYLTERFGKEIHIDYQRKYVNYSQRYGDRIFERVMLPKQEYISKMKEEFGENLEGMSSKQKRDHYRLLNQTITDHGNVYVDNPYYFADYLENINQNLTEPCIYRLAATKFKGREDLWLLELRKCIQIMGHYSDFKEATSHRGEHFLVNYFDMITEEVGHYFGLPQECSSKNCLEFAGVMELKNRYKSKHGAWVSPIARYILEPVNGYRDDPSKVEVGFGERYNQVMSWKLKNLTK